MMSRNQIFRQGRIGIVFLFFVLCSLFIFTSYSMAEIASSASYTLQRGAFSEGGAELTSTGYNLNHSVGLGFGGDSSTDAYASVTNYQGTTNTIPAAPVGSSYNDGQATLDETPILEWTYTDPDTQTQVTYQVQISNDNFTTVYVDSGNVTSSDPNYSSSVLPQGDFFQWRVRVFDGYDWSGWSTATSGFIVNPTSLDVGDVGAATGSGGESIPESTWQSDNDPYFYWYPPAGVQVRGYSFGFDVMPDDQLDTVTPYYQYTIDTFGDGQHKFYVKAQDITTHNWGDVKEFNIWVDTTPPLISILTPGEGAVINKDKPNISFSLLDPLSGVNISSIFMEVNRVNITPSYSLETGIAFWVPSIPLSEGEVTVSLSAKDTVGNDSVPLLWGFTIDTVGPAGTISINRGDTLTNSVQVTLNLNAADTTSEVSMMRLSNDGIFDTENWETYVEERQSWLLSPVSGTRTVYVQFSDAAGNISSIARDSIQLVIIAPDTIISGGPRGVTKSTSAIFTFTSSTAGSRFKYRFDGDEWSEWTDIAMAESFGLPEGNHYFMVKAGRDVDQSGVIELDEEDPTPAQRVWTISSTGVIMPGIVPEKPVKYWREE